MIVETIRDVAVSIGLAILIPITLHFGITVFMPEPSLQSSSAEEKAYETKVRELRERIDELKEQKKFDEIQVFEEQLKTTEATREMLLKSLQESYDRDRVSYSKYYLAISAGLGILLVMLSFLVSVSFLGGGFLFGGIFCIVMGVEHHWSMISPKIQFLVLLGSLITLVVLGYLYYVRERKVSIK